MRTSYPAKTGHNSDSNTSRNPPTHRKTVGLGQKAYSNYQSDIQGNNSFEKHCIQPTPIYMSSSPIVEPIKGISKFKQGPKPVIPVNLCRMPEPAVTLLKQVSHPEGRNGLVSQGNSVETQSTKRRESETAREQQPLDEKPNLQRPFSSYLRKSTTASQKTFCKAGIASHASLSRPTTSNRKMKNSATLKAQLFSDLTISPEPN